MNYYKALQSRKKITAIPEGMTKELALAAIAGISEQLRGPMSNTERVMLAHDRDDLRDIIALIEAQR
jgi:hypothetical protein